MVTAKRILVIDSEVETLSKVYLELLKLDFEVEAADDARDLVPRALRFEPHLILINNASIGYEGTKVCNVAKRTLDIPVLLILEPETEATLKIDGCMADGFIHKPVDAESLLKVVDAFTGKR